MLYDPENSRIMESQNAQKIDKILKIVKNDKVLKLAQAVRQYAKSLDKGIIERPRPSQTQRWINFRNNKNKIFLGIELNQNNFTTALYMPEDEILHKNKLKIKRWNDNPDGTKIDVAEGDSLKEIFENIETTYLQSIGKRNTSKNIGFSQFITYLKLHEKKKFKTVAGRSHFNYQLTINHIVYIPSTNRPRKQHFKMLEWIFGRYKKQNP